MAWTFYQSNGAPVDSAGAGYTDADAVSAVEGEVTLDLTGDVTIDGAKSLAVDVIDEKDAGAGVTVESVLLKDGLVDGIDVAARDHAQAHTIASHSDTTATGTELETLTDGSDADALHAHPGGGGLVAWLEDIRDNQTLMCYYGGNFTHTSTSGQIGLGFRTGITSTGALIDATDRTGGAIGMQTSATSGSEISFVQNVRGYITSKSGTFLVDCKPQAANAALAVQGWGWINNSFSGGINDVTSDKAVFRSLTTDPLFAVTGSASAEETTDLSGVYTLGDAAQFEIVNTSGTSYVFKVNGVTRATHSTTLPSTTTPLGAIVAILNNTTTSLKIDNVRLIYAYAEAA